MNENNKRKLEQGNLVFKLSYIAQKPHQEKKQEMNPILQFLEMM